MVYAPGTQERDPQKQNMALQQHAGQLETANTNIATNTANITTLQGDYVSKTANNSLSGTQAVTNTTDASSSSSGGAETITGGLAVGKKLYVGTSVNTPITEFSAAPATAWSADFQSCTITVAGSGNSVIPDGAGMVMLTDGSVTGSTGVYLTGGSAVAFVAQSTGTPFVTPTTTPAANKYCVAFNGTHYAIYNGNAGSITFTVAMLRTRATV